MSHPIQGPFTNFLIPLHDHIDQRHTYSCTIFVHGAPNAVRCPRESKNAHTQPILLLLNMLKGKLLYRPSLILKTQQHRTHPIIYSTNVLLAKTYIWEDIRMIRTETTALYPYTPSPFFCLYQRTVTLLSSLSLRSSSSLGLASHVLTHTRKSGQTIYTMLFLTNRISIHSQQATTTSVRYS